MTDPVGTNLGAIAAHIETVELPGVGGDMMNLREKHLLAAVRTVLAAQLGRPVVSRPVALPEWPLLGTSGTDVVVDVAPGRPQHVAELKWCQVGGDKVYEVIWDFFKMGLTTRLPSVKTAHLVTAAPKEMWASALCADIFDGGRFEPHELCGRRFGRGSQRTLWDYLLEGGYSRYPDAVPAAIVTSACAEPVEVRGPQGTWALRAVHVEVDETAGDVPFPGGWPDGQRPADAREPPVA